MARIAPALVPEVDPTFARLRRWSDWMEVSGRYATTTRRQYVRYLIAFLSDVLVPLESLSLDDIVAWMRTETHVDQRGMTLRALKCFWRWQITTGQVTDDPTRALRIPRRKYAKAPNRTDEQLELVFTAAERLDPRARPTLELAFYTGGRLGSLAGVEVEDIHLDDPDGPWLHFRVAKGDDPYDVPLSPAACEAVRSLVALLLWKPKMATHRRPTLVGVGPTTISGWAREAGQIAGVKTWTHLFRHAYAHRITNDPRIPIRVACALTNHKDPTVLMAVYGWPDEDLKRLGVAVVDRSAPSV